MTTMSLDRNGLEVLDRAECLQLLAQRAVGRVGVSMGALPAVLPVNYRLSDLGIVIRTGPGTKLNNALTNAVVAFEVDDFSAIDHSGWSVLVQGVAREITDPDAVRAAVALPLVAWGNNHVDHFVTIPVDHVTGRRIVYPSLRPAVLGSTADLAPALGEPALDD